MKSYTVWSLCLTFTWGNGSRCMYQPLVPLWSRRVRLPMYGNAMFCLPYLVGVSSFHFTDSEYCCPEHSCAPLCGHVFSFLLARHIVCQVE